MRMKSYLAVCVLAVLATAASAQGYYEYPAQITATGTGTASAEPDLASLSFGVDIVQSEADEAVDEAARIMHAAMAAARSEGVAGEDMQTTSYSMWVEEVWDDYDYAYTGEFNYHVVHYVRVLVRDLDTVGDVLAAVVGEGANSVSGVQFVVEDTRQLYEEARQLAAESAMQKAEQLADCFDVELGELTSVSEWSNNYYYDDYYYGAYSNYGGGMGYYPESPSITPGSFSVTVEVSATFNLVQ